MDESYKVRDDGDIRKYYTQVPNIIDDMGLSVYEFRLYVHLKRVAGEEGESFQTTRTLADNCKMSTAAIVRAKKKLQELKLITIEYTKGQHGGRDYHKIRITDIWARNNTSYTQKQAQVSTSNNQVTQGNLQVTQVALKNNPIKNNPLRKTYRDRVKNSDDYGGWEE